MFALVVSLAFAGSGAGDARQETPTAAPGGMPPHPAHLHAGSCDQLGEVVAPLNDLTMGGMMDAGMMGEGMGRGPRAGGRMAATPMAGAMMGEMMGAASAHPVETSVTLIDLPLADIVAAPHALNVHWSAEEIDRYIACGDVGGMVQSGNLLIGLHEMGGSGAVGMAHLRDNGDGTTTVMAHLAPGLFAAASEEDAEHAAADGTAAAGEGEEGEKGEEAEAGAVGELVLVEMDDYSFVASRTDFTVGQPYTFVAVNVGDIDHELAIEPAGVTEEAVLEADGREAEVHDIEPGQSGTLTWTFTEPGQYQLSCHEKEHYEAGMVLTIEVTA